MNHEAAEGVLIEVCKMTKISPEDIRSRNRIRPLARARQVCAYAIRRRTAWSTPQIARFLGLKDHTTVIHACRVADKLIQSDPLFRDMICRAMWAPPAMPLSSKEMGKHFDFEPAKPSRYKVKVGKAPPPPKPKKPVFEFAVVEGRRFRMDENGNCDTGRFARRNMIEGSQKLARAVISALVERAA